ncbi:hypothetical protein HDE_07775 [Halotydeus destructor]|nr:hypothetical protein HDE_07775 [Halotydeus destructor]
MKIAIVFSLLTVLVSAFAEQDLDSTSAWPVYADDGLTTPEQDVTEDIGTTSWPEPADDASTISWAEELDVIQTTPPPVDLEQQVRDDVRRSVASPAARAKLLTYFNFPPFLIKSERRAWSYLRSLTINATSMEDVKVSSLKFVRSRKTQRVKMIKIETLVSGMKFNATGNVHFGAISRNYKVTAILDTLKFKTSVSVTRNGDQSLDKVSVDVGNVVVLGSGLDKDVKQLLAKKIQKLVKPYAKFYIDSNVAGTQN